MRVLHILAVTAVCGLDACKQQPAPDNTRVIDPAPNTVPNTNTELANTAENKPLHDEANHPAEPAANNPVGVRTDAMPKDKVIGAAEVDNGELSADEAASYHKTCHFILEKMVKCAKDPGFKKYQARWTTKGAPAAGASKGYEKRLLTWNAAQGRDESCKTWSRRPGTRAHFLGTGKLGTLREDAKLTCEFFGQELDDDGWFPGALTEM